MSWPMISLGELVDIKGGGTPDKSNSAYWNGEIPWASVKDFKKNTIDSTLDSITPLGVKNSATNIIPAGNIIVPTRMALGKVAINTIDVAINQDLKALFIKDYNVVDRDYLFRWLESQSSLIESEGKGATVKGITLPFLRGLNVPIPPLNEQKRIAAILDKTAGIREKRELAIKLADDFLRATFLDMFGDPVENPKRWNIKPLADQIVHANNGVSRRRKEDTNEGDIVLRLQDVHYSGITFKKELNRIKLVDKEKKTARVEYDDLLFIRVNGNPNYVGRTAVFKSYIEPVYHNDHLIRIRLGDEYNSDFLCYLINSPTSRKIISKRIKTSAGQHTISQDGIVKLEFYRPPIEMQEKFVSIKNKIESSFNKTDGCEGLFISLSHKLFHEVE
ncbi:restriction endonuclease subunit S [Yersinia enterocolitica]